MTKSNGIASLKQAAKLLNKHSPDGESLAYINPTEARLLKAHGGSGIQTLSTVPSYAELFGFTIPGTKGKDWGTVGSDVWNWATGRYRDEDPVYSDGKVIQPRQSGVGNLFQDAISIYAFLRAKKDAEGLNDAEMSEFNRLNKQLTASQEQFKGYTDEGKQLTAPEYVTTPKAVTRDIDFSGAPTPDLTIEANAQGGRIGAFNGGIQGLMPQQGMPQQGLNPRMGYALGDEVEQVTETVETPKNIQMAGTDTPPIEMENLQDLLDAFYEAFGRGPTSMDELKRWASQRAQGDQMQDIKGHRAGPDWFTIRVDELMAEGMSEEAAANQAYEEGPGGMAQGGRIGYNMGGIDRPFQGIGALNPRMGYANAGEVSENLEFVDKIYSPEAKNLASSLYYPETFEQATIGDKYGVGQLREGQEHTTESLNLANKMLDVKQERLLKLENFAQERGISQNEFKKMLTYFIENHGEHMGMNAMASYIGVEDIWEGDRTDYENMDPRAMNPNYLKRNKFYQPLPDMPVDYAHGGRIGAQGGGIMPLLDMGGMEKDYRQDGGFVPIGRKEKADDVPARLSKNEFVFTADAVKAAGGGDIDQGAQRMYNVMKNLEAGGQISEQSQGKA